MTTFKTKSGRATFAGLSAAALLLGATAVGAESVSIRIASVNAPTTETNIVVQEVAERITERTEGRVTFEFFPSAQLGTTTDSLEQASQGQPIITFTSASFMAGFGVPELAVIEGPFVVADNEEADRLANSDLLQGYYDRLEEVSGIRVLALNWFDGARHMIGTEPYPDPSDLQGVLMRVPPVDTWIRTFEPLGVVPVTVEAAEAYSALAQGVVTAAESPLTGLRASRWYEVAKHITETGHFNLFTGWVMSAGTFNELSEGDREILLEEFRQGGQELAARSEALADEIRAEFEEAGVTFHEADLEAYREATSSFYDAFPEGLFEEVRAAASGE